MDASPARPAGSARTLRNPLIWATVIGFTLNAIGFHAPGSRQVFLGRLSDASVALGLIAVGAVAAGRQ